MKNSIILRLRMAFIYFKYIWLKLPRMKTFEDLKTRINELINLNHEVIKALNVTTDRGESAELLRNLKAQSLSFVQFLYGKESTMFSEVSDAFKVQHITIDARNADNCLGCLKAIKAEIDGGWIGTLKGNIMAESFSDFMEMGLYFVDEGYKDAAAVMFGGVLEEHLRQLCIANKIEVLKENGKFRKAEDLNIDLAKNGIYNTIVQKAVTGNLGIRNAAAHAKYDEYSIDQVKLMRQEISLFMQQNSL